MLDGIIQVSDGPQIAQAQHSCLDGVTLTLIMNQVGLLTSFGLFAGESTASCPPCMSLDGVVSPDGLVSTMSTFFGLFAGECDADITPSQDVTDIFP